MPSLRLRVDAAAVLANLKSMDAEEAKNLTRYQREILKPVYQAWKPIIPRRHTGRMAASGIIGSRGGNVYLGYGPSAPVYMGVQEFGGSVPAPYSRHAAARLGALAGRAVLGPTRRAIMRGERRIPLKPKAPNESYTLYPTFRRYEAQLAPAMEEKLVELKLKYGL